MANPPITRFTSLAVSTAQNSGNPNNGLYAPELTQDQIKLIPIDTKKNGGLWYNKDTKNLEAVVNDAVEIVQVGPSGQGDVIGPAGAVNDSLAAFDGITGKLIKDSGLLIGKITPPLQLFSKNTNEPNDDLEYIQFTSEVAGVFVDSLMPVQFTTNSFGGDEHVCSLFTGALPSSSTSPSALVELQSDSGALLLSRMTTDNRNNNLSTPSGANGMLLFNTTTKTFDGFDGTNWRPLPQLNTDGTLTAADPAVSANLATKNYVDTAIFISNPTRIIDNNNNFFIGTNAGNLTLTLSPNTGVGINTLSSLTTGHSNVSVGYNSQTTTTSGTFNTSVGRESLFLNVIGFSNSSFGYRSLYNNTASYNSAFGANALYFNTSGTQNSAFATDALLNNTTGNNSSAFGYQALYSNTTGSNNAFGYIALRSNTTGSGNNAFGSGALYSNQTGNSNSAFGPGALYSNVSALGNCGFGFQALYNNNATGNSAFGFNALFSNTGVSNSAFGNNALYTNTTGINNVAFGTTAGATQLIYNNSVFIGYEADASANSLTNAIAIGYQASVGASNCMVLGGSGGNQLSVGIGITPNAQLQLPTIHANRKIVLYETANNDHQVFGLGTAAGIFRFQVDNTTSSYTWNAAASSSTSTELMRLTGTGYLGVGTSTPHAELQLGNTITNRKVVLYESVNNDHQFYGFGVNASILRYQVTISTDNHVWYAGASSSTSTELMRLTGGGVLYAKQSYASYCAAGSSATIIPATLTYTKLTWPNSTLLNNVSTNYTVSSSRATYTGANTINAKINFDISIGIDGGAAAYGEITGIAIYKNGTTKISEIWDFVTNTNQTQTSLSISTISSTATNDYYELWVMHGVTAGRTVTTWFMNFNTSST